MAGAVTLNDLAINNAMDRYFKVAKKDRLPLSMSVRYLFSQILTFEKDKE